MCVRGRGGGAPSSPVLLAQSFRGGHMILLTRRKKVSFLSVPVHHRIGTAVLPANSVADTSESITFPCTTYVVNHGNKQVSWNAFILIDGNHIRSPPFVVGQEVMFYRCLSDNTGGGGYFRTG